MTVALFTLGLEFLINAFIDGKCSVECIHFSPEKRGLKYV